MRPARPVLFPLLAGLATFSIILASRLAGPDHLQAALIPCILAYCAFLALDVRSTASRGRRAVSRYETAILFRHITRRWGFAVSIPLQIMTETVLATIVVPLYISMSFDTSVIAVAFGAFAAYHAVGWTLNRESRVCSTPAGQH